MTDVIKRNNVKSVGSGTQAILFVHGYGCDQNMWRHVTPAFLDDFRVILLDLTGFGQSDLSAFHPEKYTTLAAYAEDLIEVCEMLNLQKAILVGHSVSATIGMLATIERPDLFSKLIMIGPSPCYINDEPYYGGFTKADIEELLEMLDSNYLGWSSTMAPVIMGNPERPALGEELTDSFCRTNPAVAKHFADLTFLSDHRKDLHKVSIPSLVLQCSEDVIAPEPVGKYVHEHLPNSELVFMQAKGHCPNLSAPQETIDSIRAFIT